ncbi:response regulator [Halodesulfovibrio spirochaetisodalis]|uniref:Response regulatory domain-containing protein n=1 Tax=Halodesulfovibrio spirochaetisodalis TaxID=1560234 RepID=A0A1B7XCF5_9BACT|nr:response regulator [Halodesulfovibrio spirochaetisodalis]OBQ51553.1 hypothetical protein SP90_09210 [Halodesulfovibrio spirochaetisodalis]
MERQGRVLILDDEKIVRLNLVAFFQDEGFAVSAADSAESALVQLGKCKIDFAIVDIRLAGMGGEDFIRNALQDYPKLHCLVYTGAVEYRLPADLLELGVSSEDVFMKPVVDMQRLTRRMVEGGQVY